MVYAPGSENMNDCGKTSVLFGVFGLSPKGLMLAVEKARQGYRTECFDYRPLKIDMLNRGISFCDGVSESELGELVHSGRLAAYNDMSRLRNLDYIALPVPHNSDLECYNIKNIAKEIALRMHRGVAIVFENMRHLNEMENEITPILETSGLRRGKDFFFGFLNK